ncbi:hypothetical protein Tco_1517656 [Tanacetum coccineum]
MANENVPAPTPTRSDEQILPFAAWVPIGKSNFVLDLQKKQKNPIFQISVDIMQNTNFFRAFTFSASVPAIYIQQLWNTLEYEVKTGAYSFQLDETRFVLDANLPRKALEITLIYQAHQFVSPPSGDAIMDFVNELGHTEEIHFVSRMAVNNLPRYPVLQMLWGIITSTNVDYAKLMWEEFVQAIQTFLTDKANLGNPTKKDRKDKPHVIPYFQFTKLIICHLRRKHNLHKKSESLLHLAEEDLRLGNLKFVPKAAKEGKRKSISKANPSKKSATVKQLKPKSVKEKSSKPAPVPKPKAHIQAHVGGVSIQEPIAEATRPLHVVEGKGKAIATEEQAAQSLLALHTLKRRSEDTDKTNNGGDTEILHIGEEQREDVDNQVNLEEKTAELDQGHARSDPGKTPESQPPLEQVFMDEDQAGPDPRESHVALAGPNPKPMHDEFMANVYPYVPESLKFPADEHVILEDALKKLNVEAEVVSIATVLIYQASSSVPPLSTPVIDLTPPKPVPSTTQAPIGTATTTTTTTTLLLLPSPQQQSTTDPEVFTLDLRDLPHKINQIVNEVVKEAVHVALQAPLKDRFRELTEADMKEILHQRMFESGTYKSLPKHDKSRKRFHDDQDPPPPPPDSNPSKKRRYASDAAAPHSEQPVEDVPIPDDVNVSDSKDTDTAHLPKIKTRPEWLKPVPEEDRPATPEPDWFIPPNKLSEAENN